MLSRDQNNPLDPKRRSSSESFGTKEEVGDFHFSSDSFTAAAEYYEAALLLANDSTSEPVILARISRKISDCYRSRGLLKEAEGYLSGAQELLKGCEPETEHGIVLGRLAAVQTGRADWQKALELADESLEILRTTAAHSEYARVQVTKAVCHGRLGNQAAFEQWNLDALATYRRVDDQAGIAYIYNNLGLTYKNACEWSKAIRALTKAREIAEKQGMSRALAAIFNNLGIVHTKMREFDQATTYFRQARKYARNVGDQTELVRILNSTGRVFLLSGRYSQSEKYLLQARVLAEKLGFSRSVALADEFLGDLMAAQNRLDEARSNYESGLKKAKAKAEDGDIVGEILRRLAELDLKCGLRSQAISTAKRALKICKKSGETHEIGFIQRTIAMALRDLRKPDQAAVALKESIKTFQANRNSYEEAWTRCALAELQMKDAEGREHPGCESLMVAVQNTQKAVEIFRAVEDDLSYCRAGLILARAQAMQGQNDEGLMLLYDLEGVVDALDDTSLRDAVAALKLELEAALVTNAANESNQLHLFSELCSLTSADDLKSCLEESLESLCSKLQGTAAFCAFRLPGDQEIRIGGAHQIREQDAMKLAAYLSADEPHLRMLPIEGDFGVRFPGVASRASCVAVHSLIREDRVFGIIYVERQNKQESSLFLQEEIDLFATYANLAAIVLADVLFRDRPAAPTVAAPVRSNLNSDLEPLITRDSNMVKLLSLAERVAPSDCTVMLAGETGTGKGLLAGCIHAMSRRSEHAFIAINCAALPEQLLESELFGHERGAFTGADLHKVGLLEAADHGTVFLDEIGKTSIAMQGKLLQFFDSSCIRPVGSNEFRKVDVRFICASKVDLQDLIAEGKFLEDLYYRLNDFPLELPALREKREDIALLAHHFLDKWTADLPKKLLGFSESVLKAFKEYSWPGNVRELSKTIRRAVILADPGEMLDLVHLPEGMVPAEEASSANASIGRMSTLREQVAKLEAQALRNSIETSSGNKAEAARMLGISYPNLLQKLKLYGL